MSTRLCIICNQPAGEISQPFTMTSEARAFYRQQFPGADPTRLLTEAAICARCRSLPKTARSTLVCEAVTRELQSYASDLQRERFSRRIDIGRTIDSVPLTDETWDWLNLIGYAITLAQDQAREHDTKKGWFESFDEYKAILVSVVAKDINTLGAIFMAMRCEWTHQAAALVRTLCESLISLRYIAQDKVGRSRQFWGYGIIEQYRLADSVLRWDSSQSTPEHVAQLRAFKATLEPEYQATLPRYTFVDSKEKTRPFRNWCNRDVADLAKKVSAERLYRVIYTQTSPYVHSSAWSLRSVGAFTARGYDRRRALIDTATLVRATLVVWFEWAEFCDSELGWDLNPGLAPLRARLDELQAQLDLSVLEPVHKGSGRETRRG